jgi:hypothetical protein
VVLAAETRIGVFETTIQQERVLHALHPTILDLIIFYFGGGGYTSEVWFHTMAPEPDGSTPG